tara:strand:- start:838 stop:1482 length:645 start_codon:yes stop_codon:yes gene_type:complete
MDEEIAIIDEKTRNEKIKNFFINNKKFIFSGLAFILLIVISFYSYQIYKDNHRQLVSEKYNSAVIEYKSADKSKTVLLMREVIKEKDTTYSPLALYFLIDNELLEDRNDVNSLFDILINKTSLENEIKNLIIYKKALFNADAVDENELLDLTKPILNSNSVWESHTLYLVTEYFYSKNEKQKAKEFFNKILSLDNVNLDIKKEAQKRLNRDLSE